MIYKDIILSASIDNLFFATYNYSGCANIVVLRNPMGTNWYFNNSISLVCNENFDGEPYDLQLTVSGLQLSEMHSFVDLVTIPNNFVAECTFNIIYSMLQNGYYIYIDGIDDYYIEGKTNYKIRHSEHDGMIIGYNSDRKTYIMTAYSANGKFELIEVSSKSFAAGIKSTLAMGFNGSFFAAKAMPYIIELDIYSIKNQLIQYCDVSHKPKPFTSQGVAVYEYLICYLNQCNNYIDIRQFRMLWEHKQCMFDRILAIEKELELTSDLSNEYKKVPDISRKVMLLCEKFNMTKDRGVILRIIDNIREIKRVEYSVLHKLIKTI